MRHCRPQTPSSSTPVPSPYAYDSKLTIWLSFITVQVHTHQIRHIDVLVFYTTKSFKSLHQLFFLIWGGHTTLVRQFSSICSHISNTMKVRSQVRQMGTLNKSQGQEGQALRHPPLRHHAASLEWLIEPRLMFLLSIRRSFQFFRIFFGPAVSVGNHQIRVA
jgi:hypothetical protein